MHVSEHGLDAGGRPRDGAVQARRGSDRDRVRDEHAALTRVSAAAADAYRLEDVIEQAADAALEVLGAASLSISRWERERDAMRTLINVGALGPTEERFPADEIYPLAEYPLVERLLRHGKPYRTLVDDPEAPALAVKLLRETGKESELAVPIVLDGEVWGEVWVTTNAGRRRFDDGDVKFLQAIADRLALVLSRAERYSRVSRLAYEDPLTGLANRRAVEERLELLLASPTALRGPLTLLLCDVDGLKDINDAHGHYAGDRALCRAAEALEAAARPVSAALVGRLGGDEFCVLLEGSEPSVASDVAAATLARLADDEVDLPLSVSLGAATAADGMSAAALLNAADRAQYAAKRRGGGRLCTADAESLSDAVAGPIPATHRGVDQRLERASIEVLGILDAELAESPPLTRVEAVAGALCGAVNAAAWAVSSWMHGSPVLRTVATADDRASRLRGMRVELEHHTWPLADMPRIAELLAAGNGTLLLPDDPEADRVSLEAVRERGFEALLATAVRHAGGSFLVSMMGDSHSADLAPAAARAQLLLRIAAAPRAAS